MQLFILKFDGSVEVVDAVNQYAYYVHKDHPKGQLFTRKLIGSMGYVWNVMHRDYKGNGPQWVYAEDKHVPKEVQFALMLSN